VCYLNFETTGRGVEENGIIRVIQDKSGYDNNGELSEGGEILQQPESSKDFTCNQYARLYSSEISFNGNLFQAKPRKAITIAAWVKLEDIREPHSIFDTIGRSHAMGQYHFEVHNGILRWFHRNECQQTVYETMAHEVPKGMLYISHIYLFSLFLLKSSGLCNLDYRISYFKLTFIISLPIYQYIFLIFALSLVTFEVFLLYSVIFFIIISLHSQDAGCMLPEHTTPKPLKPKHTSMAFSETRVSEMANCHAIGTLKSGSGTQSRCAHRSLANDH